MGVHTGLLTVEEFQNLPEPKEGHIELHHGEVSFMPPAKRGHQRIQRRILSLLTGLAGNEGVVETEMAFRPAPEHEVWVADVGYIELDRDQATADNEYLTGSPNLVVEVLSPGNTVDEINEKISLCMTTGCSSFWVVDPKRKLVSVTEGKLTTHFRPPDNISCNAFPGQVPVGDIFE